MSVSEAPMDVHAALKHLPALSLLAEEVRELVVASFEPVSFSFGDVIVREGEPADAFYLLVSGSARVVKRGETRDEVALNVLRGGDSFGEMALLGGGGRRSATVESLEHGETFCVYKTEFERLRREHASVTELVIAFLTNEVRMLNERLLEALYVPVETRVLRRLDELAHSYGRDANGKTEIPLTQEQIAGLAGTTRATANAMLRDAQERGLIRLTRGKVEILDSDELARRARR